MNRSLFLAALVVAGGCAGAAVRAPNPEAPAERPLILNAVDVPWVDAAATPGEKVFVLAGDPNAPGEYTLRREFPAGHQTLPHWHPHAEYGTVLSGVFHLGIGEQADRREAVAVAAGGFIRLPPYTPHYSYADEPVVLQVHGPGPRQTYFVHEHPLPDDRRAPRTHVSRSTTGGTMEPTAVAGMDLPHPPAAYSQATRVGNLLFVAGQPGIDFRTGELPAGFDAQARQAFENLKMVLEAAGSSMKRVAKTTIWLSDAANFARLNELYTEYFPQNAPSRSAPVVGLPRAGLLISVEAIATVDE